MSLAQYRCTNQRSLHKRPCLRNADFTALRCILHQGNALGLMTKMWVCEFEELEEGIVAKKWGHWKRVDWGRDCRLSTRCRASGRGPGVGLPATPIPPDDHANAHGLLLVSKFDET